MIIKANNEQTSEIKDLWKLCFSDENEKYIDYYFKTLYKPENCFVKMLEGKAVSVLIRNKHAIMFNGRVLQASMIMGVCTHPDYRHKGYMHELMHIVLDACEHSELLTFIQTEKPMYYERFGFESIYYRTEYEITRNDVHRVTNFGLSYEPSPLDLLKVYSAFIKRFNGFYARDLEYFVNYKKEVSAVGGKIVAYYNGKNQIQGYAVMIPDGNVLKVEEMTYLDSVTLMKLCNAALQEKRFVNLYVSEHEDLSKVFVNAKHQKYPSTMVRLNDADLFTKLFNHKVTDIHEAYALSKRPINMNEFE